MRRIVALAAVFGSLCSGCPDEGTPPPGYPQPGHQGYGQPPPGYPAQPTPYGQQPYPAAPGQPPQAPPAEPQYYPPQGYAMPQHLPQAQPDPQPAQPGFPLPGQPAPANEVVPPMAPFGPPDPGGAALPLHVAHMQRAQPALEQLAAHNMVNMRPDGDAFAAQFNSGQVWVQKFELVPGRCYGVVAVAMGVTDVELELGMGEPPVDHVLGKDELKGPQAVVGPSGQCIRNYLPAPHEAKVTITAVAGAGGVVARIYSK